MGSTIYRGTTEYNNLIIYKKNHIKNLTKYPTMRFHGIYQYFRAFYVNLEYDCERKMRVFHKVFNISTMGMVGYRNVEKDGLKWGNVGRYMKEKIGDAKMGIWDGIENRF